MGLKISQDLENLINGLIKGTTLYNNSNGTTGNIQLNDYVSNYTYIEIFYGKSRTNASSKKILTSWLPADVTLYCANIYSDTGMQELFKTVYISDNGINHVRGAYRNTTINDPQINFQIENEVKIYKVIGYK